MVNRDRLIWVAVVERLDFAALDVGRGYDELNLGSRDPRQNRRTLPEYPLSGSNRKQPA